MSAKIPIFLGSMAFVALAALTVPGQVRLIEDDLRGRARQSLAALDSSAQVEVRGRDLVLSGAVEDETARDAAHRAVASLWGVRSVIDRVQVAMAANQAEAPRSPRRLGAAESPAPKVAAPARAGVRVTAQLGADGVVTLSGQAPSETARLVIVARAREIFSPSRVSDRLRAKDGDEEPGWRATVLAGLAGLQHLERGRLDATSYRIRVGGVGVRAELEEEIAASLRDVAPRQLQVAVDVDTPPRRDAGGATAGSEG